MYEVTDDPSAREAPGLPDVRFAVPYTTEDHYVPTVVAPYRA